MCVSNPRNVQPNFVFLKLEIFYVLWLSVKNKMYVCIRLIHTQKKLFLQILNTDYFILKYNKVRVYSTKRTHSHTRAFSKAHLLLLLNPASVLGVASTTTSKLDSLTTCGVPWRLANRLVRAGDCDHMHAAARGKHGQRPRLHQPVPGHAHRRCHARL